MFFSVNEIHQRLKLFLSVQPTEHVTVIDALNRVLSEDIIAQHALPAVHLAGVDGYAVKGEDILHLPVSLKIQELTQKDLHAIHLKNGHAIRVYAGEPVPQGTEMVIHINHVLEDSGCVYILEDVTQSLNIVYAGSDVAAEHCVLKKGTQIRAQHVSLLSALQIPWIPVYKRPRVGIMVGDMKILGQIESPFKVSTSLALTLFAYIQECGGVPVMLGDISQVVNSQRLVTEIVSDLNYLVNQVDLIVMSGSFFSLKYDLSFENKFWEILIEQGADVEAYFIKTGEQECVLSGKYNNIPLLAVPATLTHTMIKLPLFLRPAIQMMLGHEGAIQPVLAVLTDDIGSIDLHKEFIHAEFSRRSQHDKVLHVTPYNNGQVPFISSFAGSHCLIEVDQERKSIKKGDIVKLIALSEFA